MKMYFVRVSVCYADGSLLTTYKINWNDSSQRKLFASQANEAVRNNQVVTTMPERLWCELDNSNGA